MIILENLYNNVIDLMHHVRQWGIVIYPPEQLKSSLHVIIKLHYICIHVCPSS